MLEVLAKPVKLPDDEDVAGLDGLETSNKARVVVVPEGRKILGEAVEVTPCCVGARMRRLPLRRMSDRRRTLS
jgi:hypothetical protein